jgi:hypothetical protein
MATPAMVGVSRRVIAFGLLGKARHACDDKQQRAVLDG